jgi:hypothetical protein
MRVVSSLLVLGTLVGCPYLSAGDLEERMDLDGDGVARPDDCDDDDPRVGAVTSWNLDVDGDGYGGATIVETCQASGDMVDNGDDCDDSSSSVFPGADELCNGLDDDCDGTMDEDDAIDASTWYADADGDGYGDLGNTVEACSVPSGYSGEAGDCDDSDATVHPGARDVCDHVDTDCNGVTDDLHWYGDFDGDGYGDPFRIVIGCEQPSGYIADASDCDDDDPEINPDGAEVCDAADVDEDCDGLLDDDDPDATGQTSWYLDTDGDGYGVDHTRTESCDAPEGFVADGGDCAPADNQTYPGAEETWYDGHDQDCDSWSDYDADMDGYDSAEHDGTDCDDDDPLVNPGAEEACGDGIDNDCDGDVMGVCALNGENRLDDADVKLLGEYPTNCDIGGSLDAGDLDGDGFDDLLIGAPRLELTGSYSGGGGGAYVVYGPVTNSGSLGTYGVPLVSSDTNSETGWVAQLSDDLDGDGVGDIVLGAPYSDAWGHSDGGVVYVVSGAPVSRVDLDPGDATILPNARNQYLGRALATLADRDADGTAELVVGEYNADNGAGVVLLYTDGLSARLGVADADVTISGQASEHLGAEVKNAGDLDGDGLDDLSVGLPGYREHGAVGAVCVFHDALAARGSDDSDGLLFGPSMDSEVGYHLYTAGDLDGDGLADLLVANPLFDGDRGVVYVAYGPATGTSALEDLGTRLEGENSGDWVGGHSNTGEGVVDGGGDLNGDGHGDLVIGALNAEDSLGDSTGAVYLVLGPVSGVTNLGSASGTLVGEESGYQWTDVVVSGVDFDADGFDDVAIGVSGYNDTPAGADEGAAFVFFAGPE